ncbi:S49 family peptidase [bacterium]|nr:S49 family peptidase [bacterium]
MAIKPQFLSKYIRKYDAILNNPPKNAGFADEMAGFNQGIIDDQYKHVLQINGDIAIINLFGPMSEDGPDWIDLYLGYNGTAYKNLIRASEEILKNDAIKQVYINSNTPGGNIDGLDAAYQSLALLAAKRPITAINKGMIASAGVWYTSAAQKIIASTPSAMIGSIGVVIDTLDYTGYYDSFGVKEITITNTDSPNKRPDLLTEEGKNVYIKELNALYSVFVDRVTSRNTIGIDSIKALKGEMIIASEAVKIGLMDGIEGQTGTTAEIQTKELTMEADVKEALDKITSSVSAVATQVEKMGETKAPETEVKKELSKEDKKFSLNIITGNAYPATVTAEAGKVLAGDSDISTLKAMTAAVDAVKEQTAGTAATAGANAETVPTGEMPGDKKKKVNGILEDEASIKAELERIGEV